MKKCILAWLIPITLSVSAVAQDSDVGSAPSITNNDAQPLPFLQSPHFYLGGRLGWGYFQDACDTNASDCNDDTFGGGVYAGYQFNDWFALEAGVTDYGKSKADYESGSVSANTNGAELSAKLSHRLSSNWTLFSRIGASYQDIEKRSDWEAEQSSQDWNTLVAVGMDYRLSQRWSLRGEYQFIDGIGDGEVFQSDLHFTSLGLTYHFGQETPPPVVVPVSEPVPAPIIIEKEQVSLDAGALFGFDSVELQSNTQLDKLVTELARYETGSIAITGHTDSIGSASYNQTLSERRAQSVANYLSERGVDIERIKVIGMGESQPIADNTTAQGREQNRRVDIEFETVVEKEIEANTQKEAQ
ncbi:porin [Vibrio campbellii]|uniref:OmpA family protein n=1 Tax=Vibrio campbellii TaxID=680 RepID=UPI00215CB9BE|nr:OmpA family protein [Vibrio campbellii]MCR9907718.1 porin [Vibrio campbellii]